MSLGPHKSVAPVGDALAVLATAPIRPLARVVASDRATETAARRCDLRPMSTGFSSLNVFEMYVANGKKPGFWLRRTTWENTCAKVTSIGALKGPAPYYGNPVVLVDIYDLQTGAVKDRGAKIPVPGTYKTWRRIDPPSWAGE
jgi:hypothetical protein